MLNITEANGETEVRTTSEYVVVMARSPQQTLGDSPRPGDDSIHRPIGPL